MADKNVEELKNALDKKCSIKIHSDVIEITFEKKEDADWFENNFEKYQRESAVCCLMPIRPKNAPPKFIFNIKDLDKFIELINEK